MKSLVLLLAFFSVTLQGTITPKNLASLSSESNIYSLNFLVENSSEIAPESAKRYDKNCLL